ncbi:unnamed protein product, partial [Nesidiocoris tenuis]
MRTGGDEVRSDAYITCIVIITINSRHYLSTESCDCDFRNAAPSQQRPDGWGTWIFIECGRAQCVALIAMTLEVDRMIRPRTNYREYGLPWIMANTTHHARQ